jgi:hypothetical protein
LSEKSDRRILYGFHEIRRGRTNSHASISRRITPGNEKMQTRREPHAIYDRFSEVRDQELHDSMDAPG